MGKDGQPAGAVVSSGAVASYWGRHALQVSQYETGMFFFSAVQREPTLSDGGKGSKTRVARLMDEEKGTELLWVCGCERRSGKSAE